MSSGDRRAYPRVPSRGSVLLTVQGGKGRHDTRFVNLSASGALLEAPQLPVGTKVRLQIDRGGGQRLDIEAVVVRSDDPVAGQPHTIAVSFVNVTRTAVSIAGES